MPLFSPGGGYALPGLRGSCGRSTPGATGTLCRRPQNRRRTRMDFGLGLVLQDAASPDPQPGGSCGLSRHLPTCATETAGACGPKIAETFRERRGQPAWMRAETLWLQDAEQARPAACRVAVEGTAQRWRFCWPVTHLPTWRLAAPVPGQNRRDGQQANAGCRPCAACRETKECEAAIFPGRSPGAGAAATGARAIRAEDQPGAQSARN